MTALGDLAKRLYDKFAATQELLEPKKIRFEVTRWEDLPEWRQEVWVTVAAEAVKVGVEIQQAAVRTAYGIDDRRLLNDPDLQTSLGQMQRGEGRVLTEQDIDDILADEDDLADTAPKLAELAAQPRRFARDCE